jgi:hypothetical protein
MTDVTFQVQARLKELAGLISEGELSLRVLNREREDLETAIRVMHRFLSDYPGPVEVGPSQPPSVEAAPVSVDARPADPEPSIWGSPASTKRKSDGGSSLADALALKS